MRCIFTASLALLATCCYSQDFKSIDSTLCEVYKKDQAIRVELTPVFQSSDTEQFLAAHAKMQAVDADNQMIVFGILDQYGWPEEVSDSANRAIFLVVDHASLKLQRKYLPFIKEGARTAKISLKECATLEDRILMGLGKPQIYGTQTKFFLANNERSPNYIWPIKDADSVDERRAQIGLPSMAEYIAILSAAGFPTLWDRSLTVKALLKRHNIKSLQTN